MSRDEEGERGTLELTAFLERYGKPAGSFAGPNPVAASSVPAGFPAQMRALWERDGFGSYADGLIWTHPPTRLAAVIASWFGSGSDRACLVFRFSFGDFILWDSGRTFFVNVHRGGIEEVPDVAFVANEMLCDDTFLDKFLRRRLHQQCTRILGQLAADECFAFVPALALGGHDSPEFVQKVKIREHLALLAEIHGPVHIG
jgi:hypothetical protein